MPLMKTPNAIAILLICFCLQITGCSDSSPESKLAVAQQHLDRKDPQGALVILKGLIQDHPELGDAQALLGKLYFQLGNFPLATRTLKRALTLDSGNPQLHLLYVQSLIAEKQYAAALDAIASREETPETTVLTTGLSALALVGLNRTEAATTVLNSLPAEDPEHYLVLYARSRLHQATGDSDRSIAFAKQAIAEAPDNALLHRHLGELLLDQQLFRAAVIEFQAAIEATGDSRVTAQNLAIKLKLLQSHLSGGQLEAAKTVLAELLSAAANHPATNYFSGLIAYQEGNYAQSETDALTTLTSIPNHAPAQLLAGLASYEMKKYEQANMYLERFLVTQPSHQIARKKLAATLLHLDRPQRAEAELNKLADTGADSQLQEIISSLERSLSGESPDKSALDELIQRLDAAPEARLESPTAAIQRLLSKRQYAEAQTRLTALLDDSPDNTTYLNLAGATAALLGKMDQAEQLFRRALNINPEALDTTLNLGLLLTALDQPGQAYTLYEDLARKKPGATPLLLELAKLADRLQRRPDALYWLQRVVEADPQKAEQWQILIGHHLRSGEHSDARQLAKKALTFLPNHHDIQQLLARAHSGLGEHRTAIKIIDQLIKEGGDTGTLYLQRGRLQIAAGQRVEALHSFRLAYDEQPQKYATTGQLAAFEFLMGEEASAFEIAERYINEHPEDPRGYALVSNLLAKKGNLSGAANELGKAQKLAPTAAWTLLYVDALIGSNQPDRAFNVGELWLRDQPNAHGFRQQLAKRYLSNKDYRQASQHYTRLLDQGVADADLLNNLSWALHQLKNPDALRYAEQALQSNPGDLQTTDTLAWILIDSGKDPQRGTELILALGDDVTALPPATQYHLAVGLTGINRSSEATRILKPLIASGTEFDEKLDATKLLKRLTP